MEQIWIFSGAEVLRPTALSVSSPFLKSWLCGNGYPVGDESTFRYLSSGLVVRRPNILVLDDPDDLDDLDDPDDAGPQRRCGAWTCRS